LGVLFAGKSQTQETLKGFLRQAQNEFGLRIKKIRSDNGTEFKISQIEGFLEEEGIKHEFSSPYTPQQNGVVERKNRTLLDMARTMLDEYKISDRFWAEAINTACYAINRLYLHRILKKASYELLTGKKLNVSYFRVFGSKCFILVKRGRKSKFAPKAVEGFLLGYDSNTRAYRVFNKSIGLVEVSCDIVFDETNGSQVEQVDLDELDDEEAPCVALRNMSIGDVCPKESEEPPQAQDQPSSSIQVEGLDFGETYAPVARLESIRILLAYATYRGFKLYQMDVNNAFLNGPIKEEVYVEQPPGFEDSEYPNHVYKLSKAHYGLKQAPRAWYECLRDFLISNDFKVGKADPTLFTKTIANDLFVCQIYVDDIIFGSTNKSTCEEFSRIMVQKFEMSMMGELKYFLGFQVKQLQEGTFISQTKYIQDILTKFGMKDAKPIKTPMGTNGHLDLDTRGKSVDQKVYWSMIGSLLYLCASRPDIMLSVCMCARFQADPKEVHLRAVKRILKYLVYTPKFGLWYLRGSTFDLIGYSDADWAGCKIDRKSTSGTWQFLGRSLVSWASKKQNSVVVSTAEAEYIATGHCCT
jgi:hypothetical protein